MRNPKVETVRGVNDVLTETYRVQQQIQNQLSSCFESFGYRPIDVPVIEYTELFLRKSGEELISRMYDFTYHSRRLCLRPELTASVARAYVNNGALQGEPHPVRLFYSGPAFRYEKPQRGRYRQFTQMGIEAIGAGGTMADGEMIAIACQSLDQLGLQDYGLVMGNIAVLNQFLAAKPLENRLRNFLLANMELLRNTGRAKLEEGLEEIYPAFSTASEENSSSARLKWLFKDLDPQEAHLTILELLESMNVNLVGMRQPEEIARRLLAKIEREDQQSLIKETLAFMEELGQLKGKPEEVLPAAEQLLKSYEIDSEPLVQLKAILTLLESYDLDSSKIMLDFGMSRGIQYYTGTIFEIHHNTLGKERQLCGGGRYDDLVRTVGGHNDIPASGFSFGIERIRLAMEKEGILPVNKDGVHALIIPVSEAEWGYSIQVAEKLRHSGLRVEMDVRGKNVKSNLQYASKRGIPYAMVVGERERLAGTVVVKNMATREQQELSLDDVAMAVEPSPQPGVHGERGYVEADNQEKQS